MRGPLALWAAGARVYVCVCAHVKEFNTSFREGFGTYIAAPLSQSLAISTGKRQLGCSFF